jgi:hypothetical protein
VASSAKIQNGWREILARVYALDASTQAQADISRFKIGEGGSSGGSPITPDETYTDLESEGAALAGGGTAIFTNSSAIVTGTGTNFTADVSAGEWIKPGPTFSGVGATPQSAGDPGSEYDEWGEVQSVDSTTQITLVSNYTGATTAVAREVRKAAEPLFTFRKTLTTADVLYSSGLPAITEVTMNVLSGEANSDQLGNDPDFYEVGVFDSNGVMVAYMTMDLQTKIVGVQLVNVIDMVF